MPAKLPDIRIWGEAEGFSEFLDSSAEDRAFILIREYFEAVERRWNEGGHIPDSLSESFFSWFNDPGGRTAKDVAMKRLIEAHDVTLQDLFGLPAANP